MDALRPLFLAGAVDPRTLQAEVYAEGALLSAELSGRVVGPVLPCRFFASAPCDDAGRLRYGAPYAVTLEMELPAVGALVVELGSAGSGDPEADLEEQLDRANDRALARLRLDDDVQRAWLEVASADCTLQIERGFCTLTAMIEANNWRRFARAVDVMTALSTSPARLDFAIEQALGTDVVHAQPYR